MPSVMIVEDDADTREMLERFLQLEGFDVRTAANGQIALEALQADSALCVILLDLMMPVMNGYEFYAKMREIPGDHPPVIVVSAVAPMRAELPGIHATLPKPFEFSQLLSRVATAVTHGPTQSAAAI